MIGKKSVNAGFHHMFHLGIDKDMMEMSLFQLFRNIGKNLLVLLLSYYLYEVIGYTLLQILLFYVLWQVCFTLASPFSGYIIKKIGLKHSIALRPFGSGLMWAFLPHIITGDFVPDMTMLFPFFFIRAICALTSEIAYDIFLTHHVTKEKKGKTLAYIQVAIMLSAFLSPIVGGIVTYLFGFEYVVYVALFFFLLSGMILLFTPDEKVKVDYNTNILMKDLVKEVPKSLIFAEFGRCFFDAIMWVIWPLFLVYSLTDVRSMGAIAGIASGVSMIVAIVVGRRMDKPKKKTSHSILFHAGVRSFLINSMRGFFLTPVMFTVIDATHKINQQTINVPYDYEFYHWLKHHNSVERSHLRWIIGENIYVFALCFSYLLFHFFKGYENMVFISLFALAGLSVLWCQHIAKCVKK